jgi:hypothetical protein
MSSSISSFRTELKVVVLVLLVLGACELVVRLFERRLADVNAPLASKRLMEGDGQRVLILGNSLVRDDVNTKVLEEELRAQGTGPVRVERVYLQNTTVGDWYFAFKHYFIDTGRLPDTLILCYANQHLQDYAIQRQFVARYYSSARDIPEIFRDDVQDFDSRVEFLLSAHSASFTHRAGIQRRLFDLLIPHYRESAVRLNDFLSATASKRMVSYQPTYQRLERLIKMAQSQGVRVILVAMPVKNSYPIAPEIKSLVETRGLTFIDARFVEGLNEENYNDVMHLSSKGANIFSRSLARELAEYLKRTASP